MFDIKTNSEKTQTKRGLSTLLRNDSVGCAGQRWIQDFPDRGGEGAPAPKGESFNLLIGQISLKTT